MLKIPWGISDTEYTKFLCLYPFLLLAPDVFAGRTARELWWIVRSYTQPASSSSSSPTP
jgi:hypothetical protein